MPKLPFIPLVMARIVFTLEDGVEIETELDGDVITVGRHPESLVVLPSASVSSHHATIKRRGADYFVQDLGTTNGTKLNGVDVEEAKLEDGDKVTFGDVSGIVHLTDGSAAPKGAGMPTPDIIAPPTPPAPPSLSRHRSATAKRTKVPQYEESSGCASFLLFLVFLLLAFIAGLHLRHYSETQKVLIQDVWEKFGSKITGKAMHQIEDGPAAPGPGTEEGK